MAFRDLMTDDILDSDVIYVGIPYDLSASIGKGAKEAPQKLRDLSEFLPPYTISMNDIKPLKIHDEGDFIVKKTNESFDALSNACLNVLNLEKFTLFVGGDHAVAIGTEKAFIDKCKRDGKTPVILHMDAHADICDYYDGSKLSHATPVKRAIDNGMDTKNITMFGIRSYEDQEVEYLSSHKELKIYSSNDINDRLDDVIDETIKKYSKSEFEVHISLDIDMFDPSYAPGTGTPEHFGVETRNGLKMILEFIKRLNVTSMDLVEISPRLDINDITSWLGLKLLYEIFYQLKEKLGK